MKLFALTQEMLNIQKNEIKGLATNVINKICPLPKFLDHPTQSSTQIHNEKNHEFEVKILRLKSEY